MTARTRWYLQGLVFLLGIVLIVGGIATGKHGAAIVGLIVAAVNAGYWLRARAGRPPNDGGNQLGALVVCGLAAMLMAEPCACETTPDRAAGVRAAETAFAKTMADRDLESFKEYVAEEAVFFGSRSVLRGRTAVAAGWSAFFEGAEAPFSWTPETVEVLDSGKLALSAGPVLDPQGKRIGTFNSIWRLEADGRWRVVFDKGCPPCECPPERKSE